MDEGNEMTDSRGRAGDEKVSEMTLVITHAKVENVELLIDF